MREIAVSKLKVTCLAVVEDVRRTRQPIRITRFGKPVAEIVPAVAPAGGSWLGRMSDSIEVVGDITSPVGAFDKWAVRGA